MKIKQNREFINVFIKDDCKTFYYLKDLTDRNFKNKISNKNKIIVFNNPEEKTLRKYFLKILSKIYIKKTDKNPKSFLQMEKTANKTIKIVLLQTNQIQEIININIEYDKIENSIKITMDKKNRFILRAVKNIFKNYKVLYYPSLDKTYIHNIDKNIGIVLQHFIATQEIMGMFLNIQYKVTIFDDINDGCIKKMYKKDKIANILLDDFYKKLHCDSSDPYEKIRKSYLFLVKKYHPDSLCNDNEIILRVYRKKFQEIQQAYKTIKEYHRYMGNVA